MILPLTAEQAELVARLHTALGKLGYPVLPFKGPGTSFDLAALTPSLTAFIARGGSGFKKRLQKVPDPLVRATIIAVEAERQVKLRSSPGAVLPVKAVEIMGILATGFLAYRSGKQNVAGRVATIAGLVEQLTAAKSR